MDDLFNQLDALDDTIPSRDGDIVRAPFGYPGAKDRSIQQLLLHLPVRDKWIDVCGGSGIVTMNRVRSKIIDVYNDRWSGVTTFFRCLRDKDKFPQLLDSIQMVMHSREDFVYAKANWDNPKINDIERATLFYIMLSQSFGTLGRNWARTLNSRCTFKRKIDIPHWRQIHSRFCEVQIENLDMFVCFNDYDGEGTVFYVDPPYPNTDSGIYKHKFNEHRKMLDRIFTLKGYVAVSSYKNDLYDNYPWTNIESWESYITIDSKSSSEGGHREYDGRPCQIVQEMLYIKESV